MLLVQDVRSEKTRVAVSATDSLRLAGLPHHLESNGQFEVLSDQEEGAADVFVIAAAAFNPSVMTLLRRASSCSDSPLVLVIDDITVSQLAAAVEYREAAEAARRFRQRGAERGFSMALSRIGDPADRDCVIALCYDNDKRLAGLLQFTHEPSAARRRSRPSTRVRPRRPFVRPASTLSAFPSVRHTSGFAAVVQQRRISQGGP